MTANKIDLTAKILTGVVIILFILSFKYIAALFIVLLFFFLVGAFSMIF